MIVKSYAVLAINKNDSNDIIGLCQHSFCMNWQKGRANLFIPSSYSPINISHSDYINEQLQLSKHNYNCFHYKDKYYEINQKNKKLYWEVLTDMKSHEYRPNGRGLYQYQWKWANHYLKTCTPPKGYVGKVYRVNSKYCPVVFDLNDRDGMDKKLIPIKKFQYRNAKFSLKS